MKKIELLAPAGDFKSIMAAVQAGCNAVYFGGNKFSARAYAQNLQDEDIIRAVEYCHKYNVKSYITVNTLIKEKEIDDIIKYINFLYINGIDALIVQDTAILNIIKKFFPDFEIHASTQMTIHSGKDAEYFKNKGFKRIVLSRELSLNEIKHISKDIGIETEIFVHGALCVCYSGQCLMSSFLGGRSGNRGRCAQPCRLFYTLISEDEKYKKDGYILSTKDICTIDRLIEIIESGTSSIKIEGRMKRPEYTAGVVSIYRHYIDKYYSRIKKGKIDKDEFYSDLEENMGKLLQLFNRQGFSHSYMFGNAGKDMMSYDYPKNTGVYVGKIENGSHIKLENGINVNDGVRIYGRESGFTVNKIEVNGREVKSAGKLQSAVLYPQRYKRGDIIYKTSDKELEENIEKIYSDKYNKKVPLKLDVSFDIGKPIVLTSFYDNMEFTCEGEVVQVPINAAVSRERIREALTKCSNTPFCFDDINFLHYEPGFIAVSSINEARRELIKKIENYIKNKHIRKSADINFNLKNKSTEACNQSKGVNIIYVVQTKEQFKALCDMNVKNICADLFMRGKGKISIEDIKDKCVYLRIPNIIREDNYDYVCSMIDKCNVKGIVTSNIGIINKYKDKYYIISDYKSNIMNSLSLGFYEKDINMMCLSVELSKKDIMDMIKDYGKSLNIQMLVYGRAELMVSEYCPLGCVFGHKSMKNSCKSNCMSGKFFLKDRKNKEFLITTDKFCRMHLYNSVAHNLINEIDEIRKIGIENFRVDFTDESYDDVRKVVEGAELRNFECKCEFTRGHFRKGVD